VECGTDEVAGLGAVSSEEAEGLAVPRASFLAFFSLFFLFFFLFDDVYDVYFTTRYDLYPSLMEL